ncbi:MAG: sulfolactate dehydrogenase [Rhodospirillaceae bacterium TMED8]|nr:sulfolactate dehydrogenase [Magnetovibrio sp.]OUT47806.1 MAG: sulfolactate dehydrogenase [Rhodospirillaceae bacterium TMED8]
MPLRKITLTAVENLARRALESTGVREESAVSVARAITAAERDGIASHGLVYLPTYCEHVQCGKVLGLAVPKVELPVASAVVVDAGCGFAHPAIEAGFESLVPLAHEVGIAGLAIRNSYNCGVLGYHVEYLAERGLLGLGFTNAPASISPVGGFTPVIGTNPVALAVPGAANSYGKTEAVLVIDQSASVVAKSEIMMHARAGRQLPAGWALDAEGNTTTNAEAALKGSMVPSGGYKGFGIGLMVEIFAAVLAGATLGKDASQFGGNAGGPPRTGQFFVAIAPDYFSGGKFDFNMGDLKKAIESQPGARLPGSQRLLSRSRSVMGGIHVDENLIARLEAFTTRPNE